MSFSRSNPYSISGPVQPHSIQCGEAVRLYVPCVSAQCACTSAGAHFTLAESSISFGLIYISFRMNYYNIIRSSCFIINSSIYVHTSSISIISIATPVTLFHFHFMRTKHICDAYYVEVFHGEPWTVLIEPLNVDIVTQPFTISTNKFIRLVRLHTSNTHIK